MKCNHFHYLEIRKNTSFLISLLHVLFKQFQKEKNVLPKIFLFMASMVAADAEDWTGEALKIKNQSLQCKHKRCNSTWNV